MKIITLLLALFFMVGCAGSTKLQQGSVTETLDSQGRVVQRTQTMDSRSLADIELAKAVGSCWETYHDAAAPAIPKGATAEQIVIIMTLQQNAQTTAALAQAVSGQHPCQVGPNSNAVEMVRLQENTKRMGHIKSMLGLAAGAYLGGEALDVLGAAVGSGGVHINGDQNQVRGTNTGQNGTASYVEQTAPYGGVPLSDGEVNPITLTGDEAQSMASVCAAAGGVWISSEQRCSDGNGGTISF